MFIDEIVDINFSVGVVVVVHIGVVVVVHIGVVSVEVIVGIVHVGIAGDELIHIEDKNIQIDDLRDASKSPDEAFDIHKASDRDKSSEGMNR